MIKAAQTYHVHFTLTKPRPLFYFKRKVATAKLEIVSSSKHDAGIAAQLQLHMFLRNIGERDWDSSVTLIEEQI